MKNLNVSVQGAGSDSTAKHKFPWKWYLSDLAKVKKNGCTVFSCFSCGGGSSMGYKLAGYEVIGNVEIDPRVMKVYQVNNHPKYPYLMDVRDFLKIKNEDLPEELFHLDILDGSPPCSVFSTAGDREKAWGKEKTFREGQKKQKLDDLFFYFIQVAKKLQPKVVIAENVSGLIKGNAKGYVNEIFKAFDEAGYKTQLFLLNAAFMGVPQKRERCIFICSQKKLAFSKIHLNFNEPPIQYGEVKAQNGIAISKNSQLWKRLKYLTKNDLNIGDIAKRVENKISDFNQRILWDNRVAQTLPAGNVPIRASDKTKASAEDCRNISTFPQDYQFGQQQALYICGMSVPPVMMAQISSQVYEQWLKE